MKCSKRSKLTHTSPKTSCLRVSLRQGNLAGAKGPVCVALRVCVGHITVKGGFLGVHVGQDSEIVCDGQGETKRISLVCLRECSNTHIHRHKGRNLSPGWISCTWYEGSRSGILVCV